mmetsp:Transcript_12706/g.28045  ORF Transcript_12706/g.28045 Transcript_12706/m.28045 type:complete len:289 (+) Transcript_12706:243-1109(+)
MRHRRHFGQGEERHLVIKIIEEARNGEEPQELSPRVSVGEGGRPRGPDRGGPFDEERGGEDEEEAEDGEDGEHVRRGEVFAEGFSVQDFLGEDGFGGRGDGADRSGDEREPGESEFLHRGEADAAHDGDQGQIYGEGQEVLESHGRDERRPDRLRRFENVRERDGSGTERNDAGDVSRREEERLRAERLHVIHRKLGGLPEPGEPEKRDVRKPEKEFDGGGRPRDGQCVEDALVADVVADIEDVPQREEDREADFSFDAVIFYVGRVDGAKLAAFRVVRVALQTIEIR